MGEEIDLAPVSSRCDEPLGAANFRKSHPDDDRAKQLLYPRRKLHHECDCDQDRVTRYCHPNGFLIYPLARRFWAICGRPVVIIRGLEAGHFWLIVDR